MGVCLIHVEFFMNNHVLIYSLRYESGCPRLIGSFTFSRKRNVVELELKQDTTIKGSKKFLV